MNPCSESSTLKLEQLVHLVECECHRSVLVRCCVKSLVVTNVVYFWIVIESRREDPGETVGGA